MRPTWTARRPSWRRPTWPAQRLRQVLDRRRRGLDLHDGRRPRRVQASTPDVHRRAITVATADGTTQVDHRHHARHQRRGGDHRDERRPALRRRPTRRSATGGDLDATDVDSSATFVAQTDVAGSNGYGKFSIDADGHLDLHDGHGPRRVRGVNAGVHRQHHGGDGRRHDAGHRPSPCTAPTTRR